MSAANLRRIFSIGYRVSDGSLDGSAYDLLASEARLASFIAIAKGDVPVSHWFHLGRQMAPVGLGSVLVSWAGSMFEYLMPALVMNSPSGSLLEDTCQLVVQPVAHLLVDGIAEAILQLVGILLEIVELIAVVVMDPVDELVACSPHRFVRHADEPGHSIRKEVRQSWVRPDNSGTSDQPWICGPGVPPASSMHVGAMSSARVTAGTTLPGAMSGG